MRGRTPAPGISRPCGVSYRGIRADWERHLVNRVVADCPLETTRAPTDTLLAFDHKESHSRSKRRRTVYQYLQDAGLRILLVDFRDGRLNDGHVTCSFHTRGFRGCQVDALLTGRSQVLQNGSRNGAVKLHFALSIQHPAERLIKLALKCGYLLLDTANAPFDIALQLVAQAIFQLSAYHSVFLRCRIFVERAPLVRLIPEILKLM